MPKSKDKVLKVTTEFSLECLMDTILAEYVQVSTVPSGEIINPPTSHSFENNNCLYDESITLRPLCHYETGCPRNLNEFLISAKKYNMKPKEALSWYARSRLRYSCSTVTATLVRYLIPAMMKMGISDLYSQTLDRRIPITDIKIYTLMFVPQKTHAVHLTYSTPIPPSTTDIVEARIPSNKDPCSHNVLKCHKSGVILDITLGQFMGEMSTYIFGDEECYISSFPGKVKTFYLTDESAINQQIQHDNLTFYKKASPDSIPSNFTKRVFCSLTDEKKYCKSCYGPPSTLSRLMRCSRCQKVVYCGKDCQILHWKKHKVVCNQHIDEMRGEK